MDKVRAIRLAKELAGQVFNNWIVGELISWGKSALVLHAKTLKAGMHDGVIKIFDPEVVERFGASVQLERIEREKSLCGHGHSNLVDVFDGGYLEVGESTFFYVVMEYVPGDNLSDILEEITVEEMAQVIADIASAALFLEERGIVHRDIKPENIKVIRTNDVVNAVLMDLCVIKPFKAESITDDDFRKEFVSTLRYSPPELLLRQEDGTVESWRAITFYQLGAVLHDLIMKHPLFIEDSDPFTRLSNAVQNKKPVLNSQTVPNDILSLAQRCLAKSASTRLKVVQWDDFFGLGARAGTLEDLKARLHKTGIVASEKLTSEVPNCSKLKIRRKVTGFTEALCEVLRNECVQNRNIFPPLECRPLLSTDNCCYSVLVFSRCESKGLFGTLGICLSITLIDSTEDIVEICGRCKVSSRSISDSELQRGDYFVIYRGPFSINYIKDDVLMIVYSCYELGVQRLISANSGLKNGCFTEEISL